MHPAALLALYCAVTIAASLAGGWIPLVVQLTHRRMQVAISLVSGMILGIGLLHLLPHSFAELGSIDRTVYWVLGGFLFMFFLERFFHFHHHDVPEQLQSAAAAAPHAHDHTHDDGHDHHGHTHTARGGASISWLAAIIGLSLHSLVDGLAMAAAVTAESAEGAALAGLGAALAVALHKPFDALTIGALLATSHQPLARRRTLNLLYSLVTPLGALACYLAAGGPDVGQQVLGKALGFAAGAFICIATSDLLPELQFHRHDRVALSAALLAGIALAWGTGLLESAHLHGHGQEQAAPAVEKSGPDHDHDDHKH